MSADTTALVAAAGIGSRLGLGPKAFLVLDGETLLQRVCATARAVAPAVRVAVPPGMQARAAGELGPGVALVDGGDSRQQTFHRLLDDVATPFVLLLDVARPFVSAALCRRVIDAARIHGAAGAFVPATIPCARVDDRGLVVRATPASDYRLPQMPQAFRTVLLRQVLDEADRAGVQRQTLWELFVAAGLPLQAVAGEPGNIKITDATDWALAGVLQEASGREP